MSRKKLERQLNLAICLMATTRHLSVDEISDLVAGIRPRRHAGRRGGLPAHVRARQVGAARARHPGRDRRRHRLGRRHRLPHPAQRLRAAGPASHGRGSAPRSDLAARLWSSAALAEPSASAMRKLRAAGMDPLPPPAGLEPRVEATEAAFGAVPCRRSRGPRARVRLPPPRPAEAGDAPGASLGRRLLARPVVSRRPRPGPRGEPGLPAVADGSRAFGRSGRPAS